LVVRVSKKKKKEKKAERKKSLLLFPDLFVAFYPLQVSSRKRKCKVLA
jgi:hypothetical protein